MITVAGTCLGILLVRIAAARDRWLRAGLLAQTADLVTFAVVWEHTEGELNPLGRLAKEALLAMLGPANDAPAVYGAALVLALLKVALFAFLVRIAPVLGPYRRVVLATATVAGTVGAASNVIAHPNAGLVLALVAGFAIVAVRWPARFGDTVRVAVGLSLSCLLAIGGVAAYSYIAYAGSPFMCGSATCSPGLATQLGLLALASFAAAVVSLAITVRFAVRRMLGRARNAT